MYRFLQLLLTSTIVPEIEYGIIFQQNTSVLLFQDLYTGSWGFSSYRPEYPNSISSPYMALFGAIAQGIADTGYTYKDDFLVQNPPCQYGTTIYWYATVQTLHPPRLKNTREYQNLRFIEREEVRQSFSTFTDDVEDWKQEGMRSSCLNRYYPTRTKRRLNG